MNLSASMRRQLQDLYEVNSLSRSSGGRSVRLPTVRALLARGLIVDTPAAREALAQGTRLHSPYRLSAAGLRELGLEAVGEGAP